LQKRKFFTYPLLLKKLSKIKGVVVLSQQQIFLDTSSVSLDYGQFKPVLELFREELDNHREAINENTVEMQSSYDVVNELNRKIDKLAERLDELTLLVKGKKESKSLSIIPLTLREKEVFLALYTLCESQPNATYRQIARKLAMTEQLVASYISSMFEKGVPVLKRYFGGMVYLKLDDEFRQSQAKNNVVGVNTLLKYWES